MQHGLVLMCVVGVEYTMAQFEFNINLFLDDRCVFSFCFVDTHFRWARAVRVSCENKSKCVKNHIIFPLRITKIHLDKMYNSNGRARKEERHPTHSVLRCINHFLGFGRKRTTTRTCERNQRESFLYTFLLLDPAAAPAAQSNNRTYHHHWLNIFCCFCFSAPYSLSLVPDETTATESKVAEKAFDQLMNKSFSREFQKVSIQCYYRFELIGY